MEKYKKVDKYYKFQKKMIKKQKGDFYFLMYFLKENKFKIC